MKRIESHLCLLFFILFILPSVASFSQGTFMTISGVLKDARSGERIFYANIMVPGTSIGTVSNSDGEFTLKIPHSVNAEYFEVSHITYATSKFKISDALGKGNVFNLEMQPVQLKEIPIMTANADEIVATAFKSIKKNYSDTPNLLTAFYREYVMQRRDYLSISEAVIEIYKAPYTGFQSDQVRLFKSRKASNVKKADTLLVQLQGGPKVMMLLDVVRNPDMSIAMDYLDNYNYEINSVVNIDNKLNWVITFSPFLAYDVPLYYGKLYIAQDSYAITRVEFSMDLSDMEKASKMFVTKKPTSLNFTPTSTSYLVTYKEQNGKYYLSYERIDLKFKCDWKKKLFKNNYTLMSEMAVTERNDENIEKFEGDETFRSTMIFSEKVEDFLDVDFWGERNIIEPEESIENAIKKLTKAIGR